MKSDTKWFVLTVAAMIIANFVTLQIEKKMYGEIQ